MTDQLKSINWRELCEELVLRWDVDGCDWQPQHQARWNAAVDRVRTTLDLVKPEPEAVGQTPSDEELDHLERQYWEETGVEAWGRQGAIFNHRAFARAVLARYSHQPAPPAEGEVAELVEFLRIYGDEVMDEYGDVGEHDQLTRAADLLERQVAPVPVAPYREVADLVVWLEDHSAECLELDRPEWSKFIAKAAKFLHLYLKAAPVPVAVSERLPGPEDCDAKGRCWGFHPYNPEDDDIWNAWSLVPAKLLLSTSNWIGWDYWLPAHALPLPTGEVQP